MEDKNDLIFPVWVSKNIQYLYNYMQWNLRLAARFGRKLFTLEDLMTKLHWSANKKQKHVFVCCCLSLFYVYTHTSDLHSNQTEKQEIYKNRPFGILHFACWAFLQVVSKKSSFVHIEPVCTTSPLVFNIKISSLFTYWQMNRCYCHTTLS